MHSTTPEIIMLYIRCFRLFIIVNVNTKPCRFQISKLRTVDPCLIPHYTRVRFSPPPQMTNRLRAVLSCHLWRWAESNGKGVGETVVSPWRRTVNVLVNVKNRVVLKTEASEGCEIAKRPPPPPLRSKKSPSFAW